MTDPENEIFAVLLLFEFDERNTHCCSHAVIYEPFALSLSKGNDQAQPERKEMDHRSEPMLKTARQAQLPARV